jgi:hypothetical protein
LLPEDGDALASLGIPQFGGLVFAKDKQAVPLGAEEAVAITPQRCDRPLTLLARGSRGLVGWTRLLARFKQPNQLVRNAPDKEDSNHTEKQLGEDEQTAAGPRAPLGGAGRVGKRRQQRHERLLRVKLP